LRLIGDLDRERPSRLNRVIPHGGGTLRASRSFNARKFGIELATRDSDRYPMSFELEPGIPVANDYVAAFGRAMYNFAYLEWGIVWLAETIGPGYMQQERGTARNIGEKFSALVNQRTQNEQDHSRLKNLAATFLTLVEDRNALAHGIPHTAEGGEQRLGYDRKGVRRDWSIAAMLKIAKDFEDAAIEANALLHGGRLERHQQAMTNVR
jgi:hypothetical protein